MAVIIGSARINEKGTISGGKAGDQTGGEVSTQNWYLHTKGWVVLRPRDAGKAEKIARAMQAACDNSRIGYCQDHRGTLLTAAKDVGYDLSVVKVNVEVDCSALVRVCCLAAGISAGDFSTSNEASVLVHTGQFDKLTQAKYCESSAYLRRGDILVTKTKGHTVVVLSDGAKAGDEGTATPADSGGKGGKVAVTANMPVLKHGMTGTAVKVWQTILCAAGYVVDMDGSFGPDCRAKTESFERSKGIIDDPDEVGPAAWRAGLEVLAARKTF